MQNIYIVGTIAKDWRCIADVSKKSTSELVWKVNTKREDFGLIGALLDHKKNTQPQKQNGLGKSKNYWIILDKVSKRVSKNIQYSNGKLVDKGYIDKNHWLYQNLHKNNISNFTGSQFERNGIKFMELLVMKK